jgi:hypothetical protein
MKNSLPPLGTTIVFEDDSDGLEKYGIVNHVSGGDRVIRIISREEAGPNPLRVKSPPKL